ncbi:hypothetical protein ACTVH1_18430 [Gluconobacter cerinus]
MNKAIVCVSGVALDENDQRRYYSLEERLYALGIEVVRQGGDYSWRHVPGMRYLAPSGLKHNTPIEALLEGCTHAFGRVMDVPNTPAYAKMCFAEKIHVLCDELAVDLDIHDPVLSSEPCFH